MTCILSQSSKILVKFYANSYPFKMYKQEINQISERRRLLRSISQKLSVTEWRFCSLEDLKLITLTILVPQLKEVCKLFPVPMKA